VNRRYYTGFPSSAGTLIVTRKQSYFIVDSRYSEAAEAAIKGAKVLLQDKLAEQVKKILTRNKIQRVGDESRTMTVSELRTWEKALEKIEVSTDDALSDQIAVQRAIKEPEELANMRAAQVIADKAFLHILNYIQTGRTEIEVAIELEEYCRRHGSEGPSFETIIAAGSNSSLPHAVPTDREIRTGDFVTMDFGCTVGGYCSDMTRTVAVGSVTPRQAEMYATVLDAQLACLDQIKAGVGCKDVHMTAQDIIDASEFKGMFGHGLGHSLGLEIHESPRCSKLSGDTLQVGMVTSVEPGIYDAGHYGVRIEDVVVITETGCENLCTSPKELIIL
jgi:Xaa-Pro aminopeptidase